MVAPGQPSQGITSILGGSGGETSDHGFGRRRVDTQKVKPWSSPTCKCTQCTLRVVFGQGEEGATTRTAVQTHRSVCVLSQYGGFFVRLQPHQAMVLFDSSFTVTGVMPVPAWEPSQKGWVALLPQRHQA